MPKKDDIVHSFMREALQLKPAMTVDEQMAIECRLRAIWGGARVYIGKAAALGKARRLGAELAAGASLRDAMGAAGLSRRSGYRVLSRKWSPR